MKYALTRPLCSIPAFRKSERGNVAMMFALATIPLLGLTGAAIDYSRAGSAYSRLQAAVDATTLILAKLPTTTTQATLQSKADTIVKSYLKDPAIAATLTITPVRQTGSIQVTATGSVATTVTAVIGKVNMGISATSTASWGTGKLEVALVLDNTGSMAGTKLTNLKSAANSLLDTLANASSNPGDVKVSLVPFSMTVNVGSTYKTSSWITGTLPSAYGTDIFTTANTNRWTMFSNVNQNWAGCVESRPMPYDIQDTAPTSGTPATMFVPFFAPDEPDNFGSGSNSYMNDNLSFLEIFFPPSWTERQGRVSKYSGSIDYSGTTEVGYTKGPNAGCSLQPLVRLTTSISTVKTAVTAMTAVGDTNIPMGLVWGWHTLAPYAPFSDGLAYNTTNNTKVVVLMTDGSNTMTDVSNNDDSYYSGLGYIWQNRLGITSGTAAQRTTAMDNRLSALCTNMKAAAKNIQIYTVRVEVTSGTSTVLSNCATDPTMFYDVSDSAQLNAVFSAIGDSITQLHLSH